MQVVRKHLVALAAACLLAVLAFGGIPVQEALGDWWTPASGGNTLTVNAADSGSEYADDIGNANVMVDVYKIASAEPRASEQTFDYTPVGAFSSLQIPASPTAADWELLAEEAAKLATSNPDFTESTGESISGLDDGLYLVIAHGKDYAALTAESESYKYEFQPMIVALPNTPSFNTADPEGWMTEVTMSLKPARIDNPSVSPTPGQSTTTRNAVKTGDPTDLVPFYIALMASGVLLLILGVNSLRRRSKRG